MKTAKFHQRGADKIKFGDLGTFSPSPVSINSCFIRKDNGGTKMDKLKITEYDKNDDKMKVFVTLDIEHPNFISEVSNTIKRKELPCFELGILNTSQGFLDCIDVTGDDWAFKPGVKIAAMEGELMFSIS